MRLDAFGYTTKRKGTNCFFVQPDVWELLHYVQDQLQCKGTELLCEVHDHYVMQKALAEHSIWAYDFCLPFLVLQVLPTSAAASPAAPTPVATPPLGFSIKRGSLESPMICALKSTVMYF